MTYWYSHHAGFRHGELSGQLKTRVRFRNAPAFDKIHRRGHVFGIAFGAPAVTQATIVSISSWDSDRSFAKWPYCGSANHGGMILCCTASLMAPAQGRVSSYVSIENGASLARTMATLAVLLENRRDILGKCRAGHIAHLREQTCDGAKCKQNCESAFHRIVPWALGRIHPRQACDPINLAARSGSLHHSTSLTAGEDPAKQPPRGWRDKRGNAACMKPL